jgi:class 3 adenylate cyclase
LGPRRRLLRSLVIAIERRKCIVREVVGAASTSVGYTSSTVRDMLLGGDTRFEDRGEHTLKGFDQPWKLYELSA